MQILLIKNEVQNILDVFSMIINIIEDTIVIAFGIKHFYYFLLKKREKYHAVGSKIGIVDNICLAWFTMVFVANGAHALLYIMIRIHNYGSAIADASLMIFGYIWTPIFLVLNSTSVIFLFYYAASNK